MTIYGPGTVEASSAKTATGTSASYTPKSEAGLVSLLVNVSAVSGTTPTLDLSVEWSNNGTVWAVADVADTFTQITAAKVTCKQFARKGQFMRLRWTIGGTTPSFTFDATATEAP